MKLNEIYNPFSYDELKKIYDTEVTYSSDSELHDWIDKLEDEEFEIYQNKRDSGGSIFYNKHCNILNNTKSIITIDMLSRYLGSGIINKKTGYINNRKQFFNKYKQFEKEYNCKILFRRIEETGMTDWWVKEIISK